MATSIEALFKYSYDYDGKTISFQKGEKFSLIKKVNGDWWQVKRKHEDGRLESIYVPANYMKEVENITSQSHTYQNMADLQAEYLKAKERMKKEKSHQQQANNGTGNSNPVVRVSPKLSRTKSSDNTLDGKKANGNISAVGHINPSRSTTEPEYAVPHIPISNKTTQDEPPLKPIAREWQPGYSLPQHVKIRSSTVNDIETTSLDTGSRNPSTVTTTTTTNNGSNTDRNDIQQMLNSQLVGGRGLGTSQSKAGPPPTKPRTSNSLQRPKSYYVDDEILTQPSTFMSTSGNKLTASTFNEERKSFKKPTTGNNDSKPHPSPIIVSPTPVALPPSSPSLPEGWTEHKTAEGKVYYYNCITKESKWTRPIGIPAIPPPPPPEEMVSPVHQSSVGVIIEGITTSPKHGPSKDSPLERVAPRGWTKEINSLTQTPVFTNSRTSEKWALASDEKEFFYYMISNPSVVLQNLPAIMDDTSEALYDHLTINTKSNSSRPRISSDHEYSEPDVKPHAKLQSTNSVPPGLNSSQQLDIWSTMMTTTFLRKHGYLLRKRIVDSHNKKLKNEKWVRLFVSLQANQLLFYNDHRTKDQPGAKPLNSFNLLHSTICSSNYKDKKKNVIQISSSMGEQFYLEAESQSMMNDWYSTIQTAIVQTNEDYKKNPDKYSSVLASNDHSDTSPPTQSKFSHKKNSSATLPRDFDDIEEIEQLSGAEKTVRIKGRLRNLIARRPQVETLKKTGIMQESTFGCSLVALSARTHRPVPLFLENLIAHIEKKGLTVVGIYRLSGNASQVQKLRYLLEENPHIDLSSSEWADVNVVTGCLKLYFRELPDPLLPFKHYRNLINTTSMPPEKRAQAIANEINKFPEPNYKTLKVLIKHLSKVVEHGHVNKMLANNLGIVFGPTLMRSEIDSLELASLMPLQNNIVETIIKEEAMIFKK